jgi:hypothetical protein
MFIILPITNRYLVGPQLIDVEIVEMLAQALAALMARREITQRCVRVATEVMFL